MIAVSRPYLDRMVAHHLALCTEDGHAPPLGLLQVAEAVGGADWQPARLEVRDTLAGLIAEVPRAMREPAALASLFRRSDELAGVGEIAQSWFEDDPQVAKAVERAGGRDRARLARNFCRASLHGTVPDGPTLSCAPACGCASCLRRSIHAGASLR
jgi:hypothetical protein